jgi:hypothetical protein
MLQVLKATIFESGPECFGYRFTVDRQLMQSGGCGHSDGVIPVGVGRATFVRWTLAVRMAFADSTFAVSVAADECAASVRAGAGSGRQAMQAGP